MNRLHGETERLFGCPAPDTGPASADPGIKVRALVLQVARPADWAALATVWNGVQRDLSLPAPAIAVNGVDGFQLWFSLAEPTPPAQAVAFLDGLCRRYLGDVPSERLGLAPGPQVPTWLPHPVPALQDDGRLWSAFVAPDLAPLFCDEPWLDTAPPDLGQSDLLARLQSISPADFQRALDKLSPGPEAGFEPPNAEGKDPPPTSLAPEVGSRDPMRFLQDVMNNPAVPLALRIEAAKALLPHIPPPRQS